MRPPRLIDDVMFLILSIPFFVGIAVGIFLLCIQGSISAYTRYQCEINHDKQFCSTSEL